MPETPRREPRRTTRGRKSAPAASIAAALFGITLGLAAATAAADPVTIRIGYPGVGADNRPFASGDIVAVAHAGHYIDDAFAQDPDIKIEWTFFRGAGPALNESLAAGHLDFAAGLGDLPAIVGRANGLRTHYLLTDKVRDTIYLAVRPGSGIHTIEDLTGHRLSEFKGTNLQLAVDRVLAAHGLSERTVRFINLDFGGALAALNGGSIDGTFGSIELLGLRDRGIVELPYNTKAESAAFGRHSAIYVTEAFENAHPDIVQRLVNAFVRAARFGADETNRTAVFALWAKSGYPENAFAEDFADERLANRLTPLIDPYVIERYQQLAQRVHEYGLIRKDVDVDTWFEPKYLDAALKDQHLEHFWPLYDASGKKTTDGDVERTVAAQK
jgi:sulfonate transport system substrate-binding protein